MKGTVGLSRDAENMRNTVLLLVAAWLAPFAAAVAAAVHPAPSPLQRGWDFVLRLSDNRMTSASLLLYAGEPVLVSEDWTEVDVDNASRSGTPYACRLVYPRNKTKQAKTGGGK
jgi:hypothetical protein